MNMLSWFALTLIQLKQTPETARFSYQPEISSPGISPQFSISRLSKFRRIEIGDMLLLLLVCFSRTWANTSDSYLKLLPCYFIFFLRELNRMCIRTQCELKLHLFHSACYCYRLIERSSYFRGLLGGSFRCNSALFLPSFRLQVILNFVWNWWTSLSGLSIVVSSVANHAWAPPLSSGMCEHLCIFWSIYMTAR